MDDDRRPWWGDGAAIVPALGGFASLIGALAAVAAYFVDEAPEPAPFVIAGGAVAWVIAAILALLAGGLAIGQGVWASARGRSVGLPVSALVLCGVLGVGLLATPVVAGAASWARPTQGVLPGMYAGLPSAPLVAPWTGMGLPLPSATIVYCDATTMSAILPQQSYATLGGNLDGRMRTLGWAPTYSGASTGMISYTYNDPQGRTASLVVMDEPTSKVTIVAITMI